ncbi:MAG: hypothetical protein E6356_14115 [Terrisporobacter othiniensis]|nr:hypothetical protein [Terrisporobacter othiniensis]
MKSITLNNNYEIKPREIICCITIIAVMLIIGLIVTNKVNDYIVDSNKEYNTALKINNDKELFEYGMRTNVGNAFVYGQLKAIDTVGYDEIKGQYMYIEQITERYTMHTRTVTTGSGKHRHSRTETYWTWDRISSDSKLSKDVTFLGVKFNTSKFNLPTTDYIETVSCGYHLRHKYYGNKTEYKGTIYGDLKNKTLGNELVSFYENCKIDEAVDIAKSNSVIGLIIFWVIWILLMCVAVYGFVILDNKWLD